MTACVQVVFSDSHAWHLWSLFSNPGCTRRFLNLHSRLRSFCRRPITKGLKCRSLYIEAITCRSVSLESWWISQDAGYVKHIRIVRLYGSIPQGLFSTQIWYRKGQGLTGNHHFERMSSMPGDGRSWNEMAEAGMRWQAIAAVSDSVAVGQKDQPRKLWWSVWESLMKDTSGLCTMKQCLAYDGKVTPRVCTSMA